MPTSPVQSSLVKPSAHSTFFLLSGASSSLFTLWTETTSMVSLGYWLETENLRFHLDLLNQSLILTRSLEDPCALMFEKQCSRSLWALTFLCCLIPSLFKSQAHILQDFVFSKHSAQFLGMVINNSSQLVVIILLPTVVG